MGKNIQTPEREKRIEAEKRRLRALLGLKGKKGGEPKLRVAEKLVDSAAFMAISLQDLEVEVGQTGYTEEYQNGKDQKGVKKSAAYDAYLNTVKSYSAAVKQLTDLAPPGVTEDALSRFTSKKK